jgi:hypothetical protein
MGMADDLQPFLIIDEFNFFYIYIKKKQKRRNGVEYVINYHFLNKINVINYTPDFLFSSR